MKKCSKTKPVKFKPHPSNKERAMRAKKILGLPKNSSNDDIANKITNVICNMGHQVDLLGFNFLDLLTDSLRAWHADRFGPNPGFEDADVYIDIAVSD